jgi:Tfp pilus assembly protein PilN
MAQNLGLARRTGAAPRVNLLPAALAERRVVRRQRIAFGMVGVALLLVLAALYLAEASRANRARREAAREQVVVAGLNADRARLQPWADLQNEVTALERVRATVYQREVRFSGVLQDLSQLVPDNVWLTQLSATVKDASATGTSSRAAGPGAAATGAAGGGTLPAGSPGAGVTVGQLSFSCAALSHVDVCNFIRVLNGTVKRDGQPVYVNPYFTSSQKQGLPGQTPTVTCSGTVDLSQAGVSGRFQQPGTQGGE